VKDTNECNYDYTPDRVKEQKNKGKRKRDEKLEPCRVPREKKETTRCE
jgi:hypothetical protein